jgi:hypothetical protein
VNRKKLLYNFGDEPTWKVEEHMEDNNNMDLAELRNIHWQGFS